MRQLDLAAVAAVGEVVEGACCEVEEAFLA